MLHKGARVQGGDYFDEFGETTDAGVFGGLGITDYEGVKEKIAEDGLQVSMNCRSCGNTSLVTLEWAELIIVGTNGPGLSLVMPPDWMYSENNGALYPAKIRCRRCNDPNNFLCPQVTPDEARARVNDAVGRGIVQVAHVQQLRQKVDLHRAQSGG